MDVSVTAKSVLGSQCNWAAKYCNLDCKAKQSKTCEQTSNDSLAKDHIEEMHPVITKDFVIIKPNIWTLKKFCSPKWLMLH